MRCTGRRGVATTGGAQSLLQYTNKFIHSVMNPIPCSLSPQVYAAPLAGGARAVVLFNRHHPEYPFNNISVSWEQLGYSPDSRAVVRDLYEEKDLGTFTGECAVIQAIPSSISRTENTRNTSCSGGLSCRSSRGARRWNEQLADEEAMDFILRARIPPPLCRATSLDGLHCAVRKFQKSPTSNTCGASERAHV